MSPEKDGLFYYIVIFIAVLGWSTFIDIIFSFWFNVVKFSKLRKDLTIYHRIKSNNLITFVDKIGNIMYWDFLTVFIGWIHPRILKYLSSDNDNDINIIKKDKKILKIGIYFFYGGWAMVLFLLVLGFISLAIYHPEEIKWLFKQIIS